MISENRLRPAILLFVFLIAVLACNLPSPAATAIPSSSSQSTGNSDVVAPSPVTPKGLTANIAHSLVPSDLSLTGNINYDNESKSTGPQHTTPYGDVYDLNRLERPFSQSDMTYLPDVDISHFRIAQDDNFYYVFIELFGNNPNNPIGIDYGVEIDKDRDGFGDILIWAQPPYTTSWSTDTVKVYTDPNHDTGGASAVKSDAPYPGDGYESVIFDHGQGSDPDLAWVRTDPKNPTVVEFAFKQSLPGKSFMWGVWADAGLKDPSKFNYNDRFTLQQAGSPTSGNLYYPIKAIYAVDSTCRAAFGFKPTGYEPLICPPITQPIPTKGPKPPSNSTCPPLPPSLLLACPYGRDPNTCQCNPPPPPG